MIRKIVVQGRESSEFERKTPLEETCRAIARMTELFFHPTLLRAGRQKPGRRDACRCQRGDSISYCLIMRSLVLMMSEIFPHT